ncbi:ribosomal RNA-processing protein 8 isoform X2 [Stegostoma tigrinum]|uniref:ribosomal RNA-processing protein 8 isoform X2 n=1 Tax=Stegostoma tigrinum TaxID=3053191 RepID=UPI00202B4BA7|nr:ribosomal RNA-processing protein 8 isoform X2 [Stegostoma tigrinum]
MFDEEDWNDDMEARALNKALFHRTESPHCSSNLNVQSPSGKKKHKLLQTLQTLSAAGAPDQNPEATQSKPEYGTAKKAGARNKRKRKRERGKEESEKDVKKRNNAPSKSPFAQTVTGNENQSSRMGHKESGYVRGGSAEQGNRSVAPCSEVLKAGELGRKARQVTLTRQQWKNKMKNKHRNKNKFRSMVTSSAENGEQMKVKAECERILKKSEPKQDKGTNITDRHKTKIKQKKGRRSRQKGTDSAERSVSETNNEKISNLNKRTRNHNQNCETLSKRRKRMCEQQRDCISGSPSPLARDLALPVGVNGTKSGPPSLTSNRSAALRNKMEERLKSARFRYINEQLYTSSSADAMKLFGQDLATFQLYHRGFTAQVERWPENPVDRIIQYIRNRPSTAVIADFGCGDCKIARSVSNKVHSFDLVALNEHVTVCDMANVPLPDESVDIVVFCLALMGTNLLDFLTEANRVLRQGGILKIAEVASRFEDVRRFTSVLGSLGFKLISKDTENSYFYLFDFRKSGSPVEKGKLPRLQLKPCLYKRR